MIQAAKSPQETSTTPEPRPAPATAAAFHAEAAAQDVLSRLGRARQPLQSLPDLGAAPGVGHFRAGDLFVRVFTPNQENQARVAAEQPVAEWAGSLGLSPRCHPLAPPACALVTDFVGRSPSRRDVNQGAGRAQLMALLQKLHSAAETFPVPRPQAAEGLAKFGDGAARRIDEMRAGAMTQPVDIDSLAARRLWLDDQLAAGAYTLAPRGPDIHTGHMLQDGPDGRLYFSGWRDATWGDPHYTLARNAFTTRVPTDQLATLVEEHNAHPGLLLDLERVRLHVAMIHTDYIGYWRVHMHKSGSPETDDKARCRQTVLEVLSRARDDEGFLPDMPKLRTNAPLDLTGDWS